MCVSSTLLADITVDGVNTCDGGACPPLLTSVVGNVVFDPNGQINGVAQGVTIDTLNATINVEPENTNLFGVAIDATSNAIFYNADNANINIGANARIQSNDRAIQGGGGVAVGPTVNNSGTIFGSNYSLSIGDNTTIVNETSGLINSLTTFFGSAINLTNFGTMVDNGFNVIQIRADFDTISNEFGAVIEGNGVFSVIDIGGGSDETQFGTLINSGLITSNANTNTSTILMRPSFEGEIINQFSGIIRGAQSFPAVNISNSTPSLTNAGLIESVNNNAVFYTNTNGIAKPLINSGTISSSSDAAVELFIGSHIDSIVNTGTIESPVIAIVGFLDATATNGITNSGDITNTMGPGGFAISVQQPATSIPLIQTGGTITGRVLLSGVGGNALTMTGGTINGQVDSSPTSSSILDLNGGSILLPLEVNFNGNTVNLGGTVLQNILSVNGTNIFNATGGSFAALQGAIFDVFNVDATFTAGAINAIPTINVNNAGTVFTVAQPITNLNTQLTINSGTVMNIENSVSGNPFVTNNGTLNIRANQLMDMTVAGSATFTNNGTTEIEAGGILRVGRFTQPSGANINIPIASTTGFGQIQTTIVDATLSAGSTIMPSLTGSFIPTGTTFDIIQTPIGFVVDNSTLVQPASLLDYFVKSGPAGVSCNGAANSCVQLTLARNALISLVGDSAAAYAVGNTLDGLIRYAPGIDPELLTLIQNLEQITTQQALTEALESLAPSYSYAVVESARLSMQNAFDTLVMRLQDFSSAKPVYPQTQARGINFGSLNEMERSHQQVWGKLYLAHASQKEHEGIDGYKIDLDGFALGTDWKVSPCSAIGFGANYSRADGTDQSLQRNTVDTKSLQGTVYGWFEPRESMYIDAMLGVASHWYDTTRHIAIGTTQATPTATFQGVQAGLQTDVGYVFLNRFIRQLWQNYFELNDVYVVPYGRFKYTYLHIPDYQEKGFNAINLDIKNRDPSETILGAGLRIATRLDNEYGTFVPEMDIGYFYDFSNDPQSMVSQFLGGGIPFSVSSAHPGHNIWQFTLALGAHVCKKVSIEGKYYLEWRDKFCANNAYVLFRYGWG